MFRLPTFRFDQFSFWIGFVAGIAFLWVLSRLKQYFPMIGAFLKKKVEESQSRKDSDIEEIIRIQTRVRLLKNHLAADLFPLDEILVEPDLLAPFSIIEPEETSSIESLTGQVVPLHPLWTELTSQYGYPRSTIAEALKGDMNLAITGRPGAGKTIALSHFALQLCKKETTPAHLVDFIPLFVHIRELDLEKTAEDVLAPVILALQQFTSGLTAREITRVVHALVTAKRAILILDGLDELPPASFNASVAYLEKIIGIYPDLRIITAISPDNLTGIERANLYCMPVSIWDAPQRQKFLDLWNDAWVRNINRLRTQENNAQFSDPRLVKSWLIPDSTIGSPLEITLKTWGAYTSDLSSPSWSGALEAYTSRSLGVQIPARVISALASAMIQNQTVTMDFRAADKGISSFVRTASNLPVPEETAPAQDAKAPARSEKGKQPRTISSGERILSALLENNILTYDFSGRICFTQPFFLAYFASLSDQPIEPVSTCWSVDLQRMAFCYSRNFFGERVDQALMDNSSLLYQDLNPVLRSITLQNTSFAQKDKILRRAAQILMDETTPISQRSGIVCALVLTGDPSVGLLLRQLLSAPQASLRQLAALGAGAFRDVKSVNDLINLLRDHDIETRCCACLALSRIPSANAFQTVVDCLMHGDETLQQVAAECLASLPPDGHEILKNAVTYKDLMVRRAVVIGLNQVNSEWAVSMLEKVSVEDSQWVVRNAAVQSLETRQHLTPHTPRRLPVAHSSPWLLKVAGKQGIGIPPGELPVELLLQILDQGRPEEKLLAVSYLKQQPSPAVLDSFLQIFRGEQSATREAVFTALFQLAASGVKIE